MPLPKVLINTLICVKDSLQYPEPPFLIKGNIYEHRDIFDLESEKLIEIWKDGEYLGWFSRDRFITIEEWRNKQIESLIGNDNSNITNV